MKRLIKIISLVLVCGLLCGVVAPLFGCGAGGGEKLVVYNWEEYIDESVLDDFVDYYKTKTGKDIQIVYSKFDTNETMLTKIMNGDASIDVMCPSEYAIERLLKADKILELDKTNSKYEYLNNVEKDIYDRVYEVFGVIDNKNINNYFVPYMWGTLGILYNEAIISETEAKSLGWGLLWNEGEKENLNGEIYMKDSIRDAYAAAVLYAREQGRLPSSYKNDTVESLINNTREDMLEVAEQVLREQKQYLRGYEVDFGKSDLAKGVGYVNLAWSGDAIYALEDLAPENNIELRYLIPESGSNVWFDGWVISKDSQNVDAAMEFINYMCNPVVAMKNAMYIGYTSAVDADVLRSDEEAIAILEENEYTIEEYFELDLDYRDRIRYPNIKQKDSGKYVFGVMRDFGLEQETLVGMWERVKSSGDNIGTLIVILIAVVVVWIILIGIVIVAKSKGKTKKVKKIN